jgi:predicted glutamine amidotransferase
MCRLIGVVAERRAPLSELLADEFEPFLELACEHADGWGLSYINPSGIVVTRKEPVPAHKSTLLPELMEQVVTDAAILHLRMASPDLPVTVSNTHPFGDTKYAFAHNGAFAPADLLDQRTGSRVSAAAGETDSERYYLAVRGRIGEGAVPAAAIANTAADIRALTTEWESLNCLLLSRRALYAYADPNPRSKVLERRGPGFFDLEYQAEPDRLVVASTGWTRPTGNWQQLPDRQVLEVQRNLRMTIYPESFGKANAKLA